MQTRTITADSTDPDGLRDAIHQAVALLKDGEVVALPTETVYGLAADATNPEAVAKIFEAKERPSFDPLIVHLPNRDALAEVAEIPAEIADFVQKLTQKFWPGPLTLVLPRRQDAIPDLVTSGLPNVAVRQSADPVFKAIIRAFGKPIAAPSANRFGQISPTSAGAVAKELDGRIPLIVDGGACKQGLESTIIKVEPNPYPGPKKKPHLHVLRPGPVTPDDLKPFGKVILPHDLARPNTNPEVPGQLASHYAPRTPLRLLKSPGDFQPENGKTYALLSYRGSEEDGYLSLTDFKEVQSLSPGSGKLPEAAVRLFFLLRQLDELGVDEIVAEPVPARGLGIAINDRLQRAAAK